MDRRRTMGAVALAAFLAFHLTAITLRALPAPDGALDRSAWGDPTVQRELTAWTERLGHLGLHLTTPELSDKLYALASRYIDIRNQLVSPFGWYYERFGTFQSWQMFVAPHRHPARLRIDLQERGHWRTLFRERDPSASWMASELGDTRFRSVIFRLSWPGFRGQLDAFADFIARRAAAEFPEATRIRVVFSRADTRSAAEVRAGQLSAELDDPPVERALKGLR